MTRRITDNRYRSEQAETVIIDGSDAANWSELGGSGVTKTTDTDVLWEGQPTTRLFVPGALSSNFQIGTTGATALFPQWDGSIQHQRYGVIFKCSDVSRLGSCSLFVGDAGFANFYQGTTFTLGWQNDEWIAATKGTPTWTATGSPTWSGLKRARVRWTVTAGADMFLWCAKLVVAPYARPAIVFSIDDGYAECYTFLKAACEARNIPISFSIDPSYIGTAGYMTEAQVLDLAADTSGLFDLNNHGLNNEQFATVGATKYVQNAEYTRRWLEARGVRLGAKCHVFVGGSFDGPLLRRMADLGYQFGRNTNRVRYQHPYWDANYQINRLNTQLLEGLDSDLTLTEAKAAVDLVIQAGQVGFFNGHKFAAAAGVLQWAESDMLALLDYVDLRRKQGLLDVLSVSQYVTQVASGTRLLR